jgi:hypothetical protein
MFKQRYEGTYKERVKWFAGFDAENPMVHVTLTDNNKENIFYDHMIHITTQAQFESELSKLCDHYVKTILEPTSGSTLLPPGDTDEST